MAGVCWCDRVREQGWAVAHVAKAMGISRQCAHRWVARFDAEGDAGLDDRSSRPHSMPTPTSRRGRGRDRGCAGWSTAAARTGSAPSSACRPGPSAGSCAATTCPACACCDPLTGEVIRASKTTAVRYERDRPGELVHMDVKKIGRIPDGGGWRAHGRADGLDHRRARRPGSASTTSTRSSTTTAASPTPRSSPTRRAPPAPRSSPAPPAYFAAHGITGIERVMTDNHWTYSQSARRRAQSSRSSAPRTSSSSPHCPWQNGKVERFNRTLQTEWAYRQVFTSNAERAAALAPWLDHYNTRRRHSALGGLPPISRLSPT